MNKYLYGCKTGCPIPFYNINFVEKLVFWVLNLLTLFLKSVMDPKSARP